MDAYLRTMTVVDEDELGPAVVRTLSTTRLAVELAAPSGIAASMVLAGSCQAR